MTPEDTPPEIRRLLVAGYRRMSPAEKAVRIVGLTHAVQQVALARLRVQHPGADERELALRLAALWLPPRLMRAAFGWGVSASEPDR